MNILFVHEVDWLKKVVFEMHNLAELLSLRGHAVYAVDFEDSWRKDSPLDFGSLRTREFTAVSRTRGGGTVCLRRPGFIKVSGVSRVSASVTQFREIRRAIRDFHVDAILLYGVTINGLSTIYLARQAGIPVVFRSIDIIHKLVPYRALRVPTRFLERQVYSRVSKVLAVTPHHSEYVQGLGAQQRDTEVLPLPIDTGLFRPLPASARLRQQWNLGKQDKIIVFVGTLFRFSGLDGFIRSVPTIIEQVPEAKLLIVGDGPQRRDLENLISDLGMRRYIAITGFQPYETMAEYMSLATVCINPFLFTEKTKDIFPGKIIQYIACGKATVATPSLGITALVPDESRGITYASSPQEMAARVVRILKSDEYRCQMENAGLDYVSRNHDQALIAARLEGVLRGLVDQSIERRRGAKNT